MSYRSYWVNRRPGASFFSKAFTFTILTHHTLAHQKLLEQHENSKTTTSSFSRNKMNFKMEALDSHNDDDYSSAVWRYMSRFGYGGCALPKAEFGVKPEYTFQEMHSHHEQLPKFAHKYRSGENRIRHISSLTLTNEWSHHQNDHGVSPGNQMMRQMQPQQVRINFIFRIHKWLRFFFAPFYSTCRA